MSWEPPPASLFDQDEGPFFQMQDSGPRRDDRIVAGRSVGSIPQDIHSHKPLSFHDLVRPETTRA